MRIPCLHKKFLLTDIEFATLGYFGSKKWPLKLNQSLLLTNRNPKKFGLLPGYILNRTELKEHYELLFSSEFYLRKHNCYGNNFRTNFGPSSHNFRMNFRHFSDREKRDSFEFQQTFLTRRTFTSD